ncbi:CLUMA_CG005391, isoform A [Clunio marinus]|uniref:CLUMA_CG005391, isoform A n=1 Tax=Clunio marinus TaxID=568069 RepID=A0A1J1HUS7_9DIPT|nr:CLUMA_CG005391, isoform A [Clunio marinus]
MVRSRHFKLENFRISTPRVLYFIQAKKKLSKKERAKLEAEQAETLRIEMEKERLKKLEEDRERKMRERQDAKKKQEQEAVENKLRRVQLRESSHVLKKSKEEIKRLLAEEKLETEWNSYMRCNGLPNANDPSDLRKYIHMWIDDVKKLNKKEINWLLKTNEQSILTQDQTVVDLTRANLKKLQPEVGDMYAKRTKEVLGILDEIDAVVRDRYSLSVTKMDDLLELKLEIRTILSSFIDEFTFKILSNIERNMTLSGLTEAKYKYESFVFKTEIYALRDIKFHFYRNPKDKLKDEKTSIDFPILHMNLLLPSVIKCISSAIRGLWLNFDHLSDYCQSGILKYDDSNRKKLTLRQTTKREWKKRKELLQQALFQIFNEKPDEASDEPNVPRVIDVDKMYTEYEDELNAIERNKMGRDSLKLDEFEVNLRSHKITGGIFQIDYLEQPLQDVKFDEGVIHPVQLKKKGWFYPYRPPPPPKPGARRQPEEVELEIKTMEENMERMVLVNIDLPDTVSWFEPPIVCRFESEEEFQEVKSLEEQAKQKSRKDDDVDDDIELRKDEETEKAKEMKQENVIGKPTKEQKIKIVEDFNLIDIPKKINLQPLFEEFVIPLIPDGYEIKFEAKTSYDIGRKCYREKIYTIDDVVYQTRQPRSLFPSCKTKKILKVVKDRSRFELSAGLEFSSDEENDESMYSVDSDQMSSTSNVYMFSKFMHDLEDLIDMEIPSFEKKIAEMSFNLSMATEVNEKTGIDRKDSGISLTKTNSKSLLDVSSEGDSEAESDTDNDEQEKETVTHAMIDTLVKEANMKRCSGRWSTRDIHDVKFNEDKLTIQFRTGRLGCFAFASNRYSNFPFQSWEFKPEFKIPGAIIFTLTAAQLVMEVMVTEKGITLNSLQGGSNNPSVLVNVIGSPMKLEDLMKVLRNSACDVFPDDDAFCYTESSCEKNYVMEMHIYQCMACFALSHNFSWSRWNFAAGSRTCVFLMRELLESRKLPNQSTVHVTPFKACLIDCTEVSPSYCSTPLEEDYYADPYHLAMTKIQPVSKSKMDSMNPLLRQNIIQLLKSVRPLSFC